MKIRLLIVSKEKEYLNKLVSVAQSSQNTVEISMCTNYDKLEGMLQNQRYDIGLIEPDALDYFDPSAVKLLILLWNTQVPLPENCPDIPKIKKYQRISEIMSQVICCYAEYGASLNNSDKNAHITAVWSPAGGCGKTSVALAYAMQKASAGRHVTYLNMENFYGAAALFPQPGKSLSGAFEQIAGNVALQLQGLKTVDGITGITYFGMPENYDDINALSREDICTIIKAAAVNMDELVVDLSSCCDVRTCGVFEIAEKILLVTDYSQITEAKMQQFVKQNNVFSLYKDKMHLIANKGANTHIEDLPVSCLPYVDSRDAVVVYKTLAVSHF